MRTVVISHNNNPEYAFFEPIVKWAWERIGWDCKCIEADSVHESQVCRLFYGAYLEKNTLLMTSDIDMIPLSDYWKPDINAITCYGRNLSDEHQPICYVAMQAGKWHSTFGNVMDLNEIGTHWTADQDLLTRRLEGKKLINIDRPISPLTGYPVGRIDRSAWDKSLRQTERIDSHLLRPGWTDENWSKIIALITECLSPTTEELNWLHNYRDTWNKSHS